MLREQTVVSECYILQARLGEDSCTEHWLATAMFAATRFLLRFIKPEIATPEYVADLRERAIACYNVRGPSIKDFVEIDSFESRVFIASEHYDERPLELFLAQGNSLSLANLVRVVSDLAAALSHFHAVSLLYGNLNPENVVVESRGREMTGCRLIKPSLDCASRAEASCCRSPEAKSGQAGYAGSDIFCLGLLVVKCVTGKYPFPTGPGTEGSASLRYVTNALLRRNVPEGLVRVILRMLLTDPDKRYSSCADVLRDLGQCLHTPTAPSQERPFRPLPVLSQRPPLAAQPFDSTTYFADLASPKPELSRINDRVYPRVDLGDGGEADRLEREELVISEAERNWTIDDYIRNGKNSVETVSESVELSVDIPSLRVDIAAKTDSSSVASASGSGSPATVAAPPVEVPLAEQPISTSPESPVSKAVQETQSSPAVPESKVADGSASMGESIGHEGASEVIVRHLADEPAFVPPSDIREMASMRTDETTRQWAYHRILVSDVFEIVERSAMMAQRGRGSFRFIQEPEGGYANSGIYVALERLSARALYVNAGSFARYGTADIGDLLSMLNRALAQALQRETAAALSALSRKVSAADPNGFFREEPLGRLLFRPRGGSASDRLALNRAVSEIGVAEGAGLETEAATAAVVEGLMAFARAKRPLVLVFRGGERAGQDLVRLLSVLSAKIAKRHVCVVVFFEHVRFAPWHPLARLSQRG